MSASITAPVGEGDFGQWSLLDDVLLFRDNRTEQADGYAEFRFPATTVIIDQHIAALLLLRCRVKPPERA